MTTAAVRELLNGVYVIFWKDGGLSLAAVGRNGQGRVWMAPTNWINVPTFLHWQLVERVSLITTQEQEEASYAEECLP